MTDAADALRIDPGQAGEQVERHLRVEQHLGHPATARMACERVCRAELVVAFRFMPEEVRRRQRHVAGRRQLQSECLREVAFDAGRLANREVRSRVQVQNARPRFFPIIEVRLQQVLGNLVDNAIKYGRSGGNVWWTARATGTDKLEISVRDDGPGIPADALNRVFERFYRADKARSREAGGTGLGLAIVKHIVQSHGGEVWATSEVGVGTTFFFTLPLQSPEPEV